MNAHVTLSEVFSQHISKKKTDLGHENTQFPTRSGDLMDVRMVSQGKTPTGKVVTLVGPETTVCQAKQCDESLGNAPVMSLSR